MWVAEVLASPVVAAKMSDTKAALEVKALETFYSMLMSDPSKAFYGVKHVEKADEQQAIETLLISDSLFRFVSIVNAFSMFTGICSTNYFKRVSRCNNIEERKRYVKLVDSVKENGGEVKIFSSMHISGERKYPIVIPNVTSGKQK